MTDTKNITCEKCGAKEQDGFIIRIENHYKNPDHSDKTIPTGYMCNRCGYSSNKKNKKLKII